MIHDPINHFSNTSPLSTELGTRTSTHEFWEHISSNDIAAYRVGQLKAVLKILFLSPLLNK